MGLVSDLSVSMYYLSFTFFPTALLCACIFTGHAA